MKIKHEKTRTWHIDHIKPSSSFDLTDREQFLKATHYTNLIPVWGGGGVEKKWEDQPTKEQKDEWVQGEVERLWQLVEEERQRQMTSRGKRGENRKSAHAPNARAR